VAPDARCSERAAAELAAFAPDRLEHDEPARREPRRSEAAPHRRLDDAVQHPEEFDLE